ncbi:hypothetical protein ASF40_20465 [Microbacterium sp. Leaf288]|uniref:hypothetical protein n=1 Tax=Microbacterium sp. Leaf288 TaxID=1736323 RepID=UPI0006F99AA5|nr:hypothetical protein [Microbacterium sp. Leaf288]KQP73509.1 hypothetical protein ASF40_20465 [Microbacterium sp. Leaf288]
MDIPTHLQVTTGVVTVASIASVLLLVAAARQVLHGRLRAAAHTVIAAGLLSVVAIAAAVPLGLTPVSELMPSP